MGQQAYELVAHTPASQHETLYQLLTRPSTRLALLLRRGLLLLAAFLLGAGLIIWIAANWAQLGHLYRLALIEAALVLSLAAALILPRHRTPALLAASLALGGLLAFVGQTYQTGADAWQLFAAWAALSLLWTLTQRSDALWVLWMSVASLGLGFWSTRWGFWTTPDRLEALVRMSMWLLLAAVPLAVASNRWTRLPAGVGRWSLRWGLALALSEWTLDACFALFISRSGYGWPVFLVGAALVVGALVLAWKSPWRDFICLVLAALATYVLGMAVLARFFVKMEAMWSGLWTMSLFSLVALGMMAVSLLRVQREWEREA